MPKDKQGSWKRCGQMLIALIDNGYTPQRVVDTECDDVAIWIVDEQMPSKRVRISCDPKSGYVLSQLGESLIPGRGKMAVHTEHETTEEVLVMLRSLAAQGGLYR